MYTGTKPTHSITVKAQLLAHFWGKCLAIITSIPYDQEDNLDGHDTKREPHDDGIDTNSGN